ncbi:alpha carbonic anhydrase 1, chloroplastic [Oryza sativa Japonica Group]|jgi:carbonic anhydrase|uniref:Carbonic anhydrase n=3 Tax=Oryza sativa TaxID=4530 RepID=B7E3S3_ORYSJ|nr:alpha carbonic anhydrase 1, chloroplastic [Oryza sativa Japonica Group]EEC76907.1 hypothetical protein OsI_15140 [Oryza sativa Indica Group]EEE60964.1 hypothetical protein OsJ_14731 [Oryza sativa Japonica Group]KAF2933886.1 hypothetical protein DAI22_04g120500 [Oryza sativa Japonica Group]BAG87020.1 unnamed protein product [Oryza sativa Japonica Group]BAS89127.1 Os04g0412500 [Oryza sativa Japonica Group]
MAASHGNAIFVLLLCTLFLPSLACDSGGVKFGYTGSIGPDFWGNLSADFTRCSNGKQQSPIDIDTNNLVHELNMEPLHRNYTAANATLVDNIFNVALRYEEAAGVLSINGVKYTLKQMHWHSPSEHTINGFRFPLELHMVHTNENGNITVLAFLYRFGRPDPFFEQIQDKLAALNAEGCKAEKGSPVPAGSVSLLTMRQHVHIYYRYVGSLTTPPCAENVIWNIPAMPREMTPQQAADLMAPLDEGYRRNSRPTQQMNGRTVQLYHRFWGKKKRRSSP